MNAVANFTEDSTSAGDRVTTVKTAPSDEDGGDITYSISDTTNYAINATTGEVTLTEAGASLVNSGQELPGFNVTATSAGADGSSQTVQNLDPAVSTVNDEVIAHNDNNSDITSIDTTYTSVNTSMTNLNDSANFIKDKLAENEHTELTVDIPNVAAGSTNNIVLPNDVNIGQKITLNRSSTELLTVDIDGDGKANYGLIGHQQSMTFIKTADSWKEISTVDQREIVTEDTTVTVDVLDNDTDEDGDSLSITSVENPVMQNGVEVGTAEIIIKDGKQQIKFTPNNELDKLDAGDIENISIRYTVSDGNGSSDTANAIIKVTGTNDVSVLSADSVTVNEDNVASGNVLSNDSDADDSLNVNTFSIAGDSNTYNAGQSVVIVGKGTLQINADGSYTFTPTLNYDGDVPEIIYTTNTGSSSTLKIKITDTSADNDNNLSINVKASDDITNADEATHVSTTLSGVDSDAASVEVTFTDASGDKVTVNASKNSDGSWSVPDTNISSLDDGSINVSARVTDNAGNTKTVSDGLTLDTDIPDAPVISGISDTTDDSNHATVTISGTGVAGSTIKLYDGANEIGSVTVGSDGTWSINPSELLSGTHNITAKTVDSVGNISVASNSKVAYIGDDDANNPERVDYYSTAGGDDRIYTSGIDNTVYAGDGNDFIDGAGGDDYIDGGAGTFDRAAYHGITDINDLSVTKNADGSVTVVDLRDGSPYGTDTLVNVEYIALPNAAYGQKFYHIDTLLASQAPSPDPTPTPEPTPTPAPSGGGSSSTGYGSRSGILTDGVVEGIEYETSSGIKGITDENGSFKFNDADSVTFKVGGVTLGVATAEDLESGNTFLQDIADVKRGDLNDEYVENMAVFLQSIDTPDSGDDIVITQAMRDAFIGRTIDLRTASEEEVKNLVESVGGTYVDEDDAMQHVKDMLKEYAGMKEEEFDERQADEDTFTAILGKEPQEGILYETSSGLSGVTDELGIFAYDLNDTITFIKDGEVLSTIDAKDIGDDSLITFNELKQLNQNELDLENLELDFDGVSELLEKEDINEEDSLENIESLNLEDMLHQDDSEASLSNLLGEDKEEELSSAKEVSKENEEEVKNSEDEYCPFKALEESSSNLISNMDVDDNIVNHDE